MIDFIDDIKLECYNNALNEGYEYSYRKICRWFSKTFNTPLLEVEKLSEIYVLTHYFEHNFDEMTEDEFAKYYYNTWVDGTDEEEAELDNYVKSLELLQKQTLDSKTQSSKESDLKDINMSFHDEEP